MKKTSIITAKILVILFLLVCKNVKAQYTCADVSLSVSNLQSTNWPDGYENFDLWGADFDGDGFKDLLGELMASGNSGAVVYLNTSVANGTISFVTTPFWVNTSASNSVAINYADFNNDGKMDIGQIAGNTLTVFNNTSTIGNLSFTIGATFIIANPINMNSGITMGATLLHGMLFTDDVDADGKPDIGIEDADGHLTILLNTTPNGNAIFTFNTPFVFNYPNGNIYFLGSGMHDLTGDGKSDFVRQSHDTVYAYINNSTTGNINFTLSSSFPLNTMPNGSAFSDQMLSFEFGDADLDGWDDLLLHVNRTDYGVGDTSFLCILHSVSSATQISWNYNYRIPVLYGSAGASNPSIMDSKFHLICGAVPDILMTHDGIESGEVQNVKYFKNHSTPGIIDFDTVPCFIIDMGADMICVQDFNNDFKADFISWYDQLQFSSIGNNSLFNSTQGGPMVLTLINDSFCSRKITLQPNLDCVNDTFHYTWSPAYSGDTNVVVLNMINDSVSVHIVTNSLDYDTVFNFVYQPPAMTVTPVLANSACQKIITINHSTPCNNSVFHFVWTPALAGDTNVAVLNVFNNSVSVHVYNDDLTFDTVYSFTLTLPTVTVTPSSQTICAGDVVVFHASGDSQYTWTPSNGLSASTGSSPTASPSVSTTYTVHGTCMDSAVVHITVHPLPTVTAGPDTAICLYENVQLFASGGVTYVWNPTNGLSSSTGNSPIANPLVSTTYTVVGTDINGCTGTAFVLVGVTVIPQVYAGHDTTILINSSHYIFDATTNGTSFIWSPDLWMDNTGNLNATVTPLETTVYILTAVNGNGCTASDSVTIFIDPNLYLLFPSAFSPNGDGANDFFRPVFFNVSDYNLKIYNRWGQLIFESNDPKLGWDGKFNGEDQEVGVYIFIAEAKGFLPGSNKIMDGNITLLR